MEDKDSTEWTPTQIAYWTLIVHMPSIIITNSIVLITIVLLRHNLTRDSYVIGFLAAADLLLGLLGVPFLMASELYPEFFHQSRAHHMLRKVPTNFTFALSQSMLMLLNIDRLLAINWPFWYVAHVTNVKIVLSALALLLMDVGIYIILFGYVMLRPNENVQSENIIESIPLWMLNTCLSVYYGKLAITIVCTATIAFELTKSIKYIRGSIDKHQFRAMKSKCKVTVALTTLYVILWLPCLIEHSILGEGSEVTVVNAITDHILLLNSSVNVFVYYLTRKTYQISCKFILTNRPCEWNKLPQFIYTNSNYSTYSKYSTSVKTTTRSSRPKTPDLHNVNNSP